MMQSKLSFLILFLLNFISAQNNYLHHQLEVSIEPKENTYQAIDIITLPEAVNEIKFLIHKDILVKNLTKNAVLKKMEGKIEAKDFGMDVENFDSDSNLKLNQYLIQSTEKIWKITLEFGGSIHHPIQQLGEEYARGFSSSPGIISPKGVYLAGSSYWIPWFDKNLFHFDLTVSMPAAWSVVSQGKRIFQEKADGRNIVKWNCPHPMEEIFLIGAKFYEYGYDAGKVKAMAFLRSDDETLANKYLETTAQYLKMYEALIGPFPFSKFALVENFWETGYGMPSFTLLGPRVIRFPFILHSSYPHELLHNWWGNSVYVDFSKGNWCEGLTAYMADHLIKEQRGQGAEYRRTTLQKFTDYVTAENDFPVSTFLSRTSASSEAVGYGKSLMMWNMLRQDMGDENFIKSFRIFNQKFQFKKASFTDIRLIAEAVTGKKYKHFFGQWLSRTGAPQLALAYARLSNNQLSFQLEQTQSEKPFTLDVPIQVHFHDEVFQQNIHLKTRSQNFNFEFEKRPLKIAIDPQMQLMRRLHHYEIPPALSKIMGASKILVVLPSKASAEALNDYQAIAKIWAGDKSKTVIVKKDDEVQTLNPNHAVWILGAENKFYETFLKGVQNYAVKIGNSNITFGKTKLNRKTNSFVITFRHPNNPKLAAAWASIHNAKAIAGLARKLPHYGKYSYLAFEGEEPSNTAKGQWQAVHSPLVKTFPLADGSQPARIYEKVKKRDALATLSPLFSAQKMKAHIDYLASEELQGRGLGSAGIDKAAEYIANQYQKMGLKPAGNNGYYQEWQEVMNAEGHTTTAKNIIGIIPGTNPKFAGESVIIGAHYDHLGLGWPDVRKGNEGKIHYGADDNASGVAVMLALAKNLSQNFKPQRTIIFVAFSAEENGLKGSRQYIKQMKKYPVKRIIGMLNLDTVGRLFQNKLLVLNGSSAKEWKFIFMGAGYVTGVPSEMVSQNIDASDQTAFIEAGVPAVQIFSGPHSDYHRPSDTADKIDAAGLVKVAAFVREALVYLADTEKYLTFKGSKEKAHSPAPKGGERKVSTGLMPDFVFSGEGVKIKAISAGSPAEKAGLKNGDIIVEVNGEKIINLRGYSNQLKKYKPNDTVSVKALRSGKSQLFQLTFTKK
jgi:hypothetical protein